MSNTVPLEFYLAVYALPHLKSQGGLVSRFAMGTSRIDIWVMGVINLLTKSA